MKKLAGLLCLLSLLVYFGCMTAAEPKATGQSPDSSPEESSSPERTFSIAVSPFSNVSGDPGLDYIGFQISEFISSALTGFPNIKVTERQQLSRILDEQRLQLSGLTDEGSVVEVGALLNAQQMLVGSYTHGQGGFVLTGRLVDVKTGDVIGSASTEISPGIRFQAGLKTFLFSLLGGVPGYRLTIPALAKIETVSESNDAAQADYARALAAIFEKNNEKAAEYLKSVLSESSVSYEAFTGAKEAYFSLAGGMAGESLYAKMLEKQIAGNDSLMAQADPLNLYRATVKLLYEKTNSLLVADSFLLKVGKGEDIDAGDVSAVITLPNDISISLDKTIEGRLRKLYAEQDIISLNNTGLSFRKAPPSGPLLSPQALEGLFTFDLNARLNYSIEFTDAGGAVIYRLDSEPLTPFVLEDGQFVLKDDSRKAYTEAFPVDGFSLRNEGTVEVQAREVRRLAGLKVVLNTDSFQKSGSFIMESDALWNSLLLHAYRKQYTRIAADADPCPSLKDVVVTDTLFSTRDEKLGMIPVVSRDETYAAYARMAAVVYYGDNASASVGGEWSFDKNTRESAVQTGAFTPKTVLYFYAPEDLTKTADPNRKNPLIFNAVTGGAGKSLQADLVFGKAWDIKSLNQAYSRGGSPYSYTGSIFYQSGKIYTAKGSCLDSQSGRVLWHTPGVSGEEVTAAGGRVFITGKGTVALDQATGRQLWYAEWEGANVAADSSRVILSSPGRSLCLDASQGTLLWRADEGGYPVLKGDLLVLKSSRDNENQTVILIDSKTGDTLAYKRCELVDLENNRIFFMEEAFSIYFAPKLHALDIISKDTLWTKSVRADEFLLVDNILYYSTPRLYGGTVFTALDAATGRQLWRQKWGAFGANALLYALPGRLVFNNGDVHDSITGKRLSSGSQEDYNRLEIIYNNYRNGELGGPEILGLILGNKGLFNPQTGLLLTEFIEEKSEYPVITPQGLLIFENRQDTLFVYDLSLILHRD